MVLLGRVFAKIAHPALAYVIATAVVVLCAVFCYRGLIDYHGDRWQSARTLELFQKLNKQIPADQALLGFKDFVIGQTKAKIAHYRPEYAWYLDRRIVQVWSIEEIEKQIVGDRFR